MHPFVKQEGMHLIISQFPNFIISYSFINIKASKNSNIVHYQYSKGNFQTHQVAVDSQAISSQATRGMLQIAVRFPGVM